MSAAAPALLRWLGTYMKPSPCPDALLDVGYSGAGPPQQPMCIQVRESSTLTLARALSPPPGHS